MCARFLPYWRDSIKYAYKHTTRKFTSAVRCVYSWLCFQLCVNAGLCVIHRIAIQRISGLFFSVWPTTCKMRPMPMYHCHDLLSHRPFVYLISTHIRSKIDAHTYCALFYGHLQEFTTMFRTDTHRFGWKSDEDIPRPCKLNTHTHAPRTTI